MKSECGISNVEIKKERNDVRQRSPMWNSNVELAADETNFEWS